MILTKWNAISEWRRLMGPVDPEEARLLSPGSIRAKYGINILRNATHGSSNTLEASETISKFFGEGIYENPEVNWSKYFEIYTTLIMSLFILLPELSLRQAYPRKIRTFPIFLKQSVVTTRHTRLFYSSLTAPKPSFIMSLTWEVRLHVARLRQLQSRDKDGDSWMSEAHLSLQVLGVSCLFPSLSSTSPLWQSWVSFSSLNSVLLNILKCRTY